MKLILFALLVFGAVLVASKRPCSTCVYVEVTDKNGRTTRVRVCVKQCRKRSISQPRIEVGMPCNFSEYDADKDGLISPKEFYTTVNMGPKEPGLAKDFADADTNKDGGLDCDEFKSSRFEFTCKPKGCEKGGLKTTPMQDEFFNLE